MCTYLKLSFDGDAPVVIILVLILRHEHSSDLLPQHGSLHAKRVLLAQAWDLGEQNKSVPIFPFLARSDQREPADVAIVSIIEVIFYPTELCSILKD